MPDAADGCSNEPADGGRGGRPPRDDEGSDDKQPPEPASEPAPATGEPSAE